MANRPTRRPGRTGGDDFICIVCGGAVASNAPGTKHRNHCPRCLWSRHVDDHIGDRRASCNQAMEPIAVAAKGGGEWTVVHACTGCGQLRTNRVAGDDDEVALLLLALRPLNNPAFPIELLRPDWGG